MKLSAAVLLAALASTGALTPAGQHHPPSHRAHTHARSRDTRAKATDAAAVEAALRRRLDRLYLSYRWVFCVDMHRLYHGRRIWRCNVDFGDPHIVQYCAIMRGRTLVTDRENHAITCGPHP